MTSIIAIIAAFLIGLLLGRSATPPTVVTKIIRKRKYVKSGKYSKKNRV